MPQHESCMYFLKFYHRVINNVINNAISSFLSNRNKSLTEWFILCNYFIKRRLKKRSTNHATSSLCFILLSVLYLDIKRRVSFVFVHWHWIIRLRCSWSWSFYPFVAFSTLQRLEYSTSRRTLSKKWWAPTRNSQTARIFFLKTILIW